MSTTMNNSRELPLPNTTRFTVLSQAHATLLLCCTKLSKFNQEQTSTSSFAWSPISTGSERRAFQLWLEAWELAFSTFLGNAVATMSEEDLMLSRMLKTNHLACTILASESSSVANDDFEAEYRAIIDLAGVVLTWHRGSDSAQVLQSKPDASGPSNALDVREPLFVVVSRCNDSALRNKAADLLRIFF